MTSTTRRFFQRCRFFGIGSALILALWLATAIASPAQTVTTLASFDWTDGAVSYAGLAQGRDGNLYGTTALGGPTEGGVVFKITPQGTVTALYSFCTQTGCPDGSNSAAALVLATDGNFYGTTSALYTHGYGSVFKITPAGKLTTLHNFCSQTGCPDGAGSHGGLVQAIDGNFYGTTDTGGASNNGTVFKITPTGTLTTVHSFNNFDGSAPYAGLIQAPDGNFYGTTLYGGGYGTVFKMTPAGKLTTLYSFTGGGDGSFPDGGLVQASDGNFYGTTDAGGANSSGCNGFGCGTVFRITPAGKLTTLYSFCSQADCADGATPYAGLVQGTDGNLYGTTAAGGSHQTCGTPPNGCGTIFQITTSGTLTTVYSFAGYPNDGGIPYAALMQGTDGNFYGATAYGGGSNAGTIFSLSMGLSPFVTFVHNYGKVGWTPEILGQGFKGTTGVSFNATPAAFTVKSDTYLKATVPAGATTGPVTVTTPGGTLTSNVPYRVRPTILSFTPTGGPVGTPVTITGVSLTQTTDVEFCGVPATFTVDSDTQVTATVPAGAHDGIAITTPGGKTWSAEQFVVTP